MLDLLLDRSEIQLNFSDPITKRTALHIAVMKIGEMETPPEEKNPFIGCLDRLLTKINDSKLTLIDAKDEDGNTALHLASKSGIHL